MFELHPNFVMKSSNPTPQAALRKVSELHSLEQRLRSAAHRARHAGFTARAASYHRQILAVRDERQRWSLFLKTPSAPIPTPHLITALVTVAVPLVDVFIAGGVAAKRLARVVFTIGLVVCAVIVGTSPPSLWNSSSSQIETPRHWVTNIARDELARKNASPAVPSHSVSGHGLWPAS